MDGGFIKKFSSTKKIHLKNSMPIKFDFSFLNYLFHTPFECFPSVLELNIYDLIFMILMFKVPFNQNPVRNKINKPPGPD